MTPENIGAEGGPVTVTSMVETYPSWERKRIGMLYRWPPEWRITMAQGVEPITMVRGAYFVGYN